jgi:hypothetical protein
MVMKEDPMLVDDDQVYPALIVHCGKCGGEMRFPHDLIDQYEHANGWYHWGHRPEDDAGQP